MLPADVKCHRMFVVKTVILLFEMFLRIYTCELTESHETCRQKMLLFIITQKYPTDFPKDKVHDCFSGLEICFGVQEKGSFNCSIDIDGETLNITDEEILSKQDIVVMNQPKDNLSCIAKPSNKTGFLLDIHKCLNTGTQNIRLSQGGLCGKDSYDEEVCKDLPETNRKLTIYMNGKKCFSCKGPGEKPAISITLPPVGNNSHGSVSPENAVKVMNSLSSVLEQMGDVSTAAVTVGDIKGVLVKLPSKDHSDINYGITTSGDINIVENDIDLVLGFSRSVHIPKEASTLAIERNGSFAGVLLFPKMYQDDPNSFFINDEALGIEMGAEISGLPRSIDICYNSVDKKGMIASCRSWDGKEKTQAWITDGCETKETNGSITCQCSHLTFFAILLSPPPGNISSSDFKSLTYITSIGCGLSMFFLAVAFFMHCLIRKRKVTQGTKILMNLFVAMFTLNLSFLVNGSIANLGNYSACVVMAAVMHYAMLATFSWFFIEALHLYFNLWALSPQIKNYLMKIFITGWVTPAVVVIALLALRKYDYMVIYTDDGNSAKMCWISDAIVHKGVNIGYYAVVFIFTFIIFIITVRQIVLLKPAAGKAQNNSSIRTKSFSIMGLVLLLGITWAFAFFSHGPLILASYYIFTILNSFQGFFLFIYYYNSSKTVEEDKNVTVSGSSTATSHTVTSSTHQ
ncbi:adhesion G-protein coupled receptor G5-like [Trachinotus anak]|uniref:adhesion G-protein coupled receptor G5-like n=1 Tax=Trachinotus anak TaxID=443729 RepID=UPI0039F20A6F